MKDQPQYLVIYKDSQKARNKYFGPFVSDTIADDFMSCLPEPQPGGAKSYKLISPYTHEECALASRAILLERCGTSGRLHNNFNLPHR